MIARRMRRTAEGMSVFFWIILGVLFLLLLGGNRSKKKPSDFRDEATRIDRMHYYDPDDHECSVCGARFQGESMVCSRYGAGFKTTKYEDDE